MSVGKIRTEHAGAKNGGGFWGKRSYAKRWSKKIRRRRDRKEERCHDVTDPTRT